MIFSPPASGRIPARPEILVVEHEGIVAVHLCRILDEAGYRPLEPVGTVERAIESTTRHQPALVVMDVHMAGDTLAFMALLRRLDVAVLLLTSSPHGRAHEPRWREGVAARLSKPFLEHELLAAVSTAFEAASAERRSAS
ncbi:MAG: response regulator [Myxococcales bacterium]|nr:response regulator [Myxococcales bacterium]